jgi:hypothetical protein
MAGGDDGLGEVGAFATHRLREAGVDRFADIVVGRVQEEDGEGECASVLCLGRIGDVGGVIHVPRVRPKEAGAGEGGDVDREVLLGDDAGIAWDGGWLVRSAEPAVVAADLGRRGRFAPTGGITFAENRADGAVNIGLEGGAAKNSRLAGKIGRQLKAAKRKAKRSGKPERVYTEFDSATLETWSRKRRVVAKAEWTEGKANPRFVVTSLGLDRASTRFLYEDVYCARGDMKNRIKECQRDLFADRMPAAEMRVNCKNACNIDPLRGAFASNSDPL